MNPVRIVILGSPFTPIFEIGERISDYHNLDFITLETDETSAHDYFGDNIDSTYLDVGDLTGGSASQHMSRDPGDWAKMKDLAEIYVSAPDSPLTDDERLSLTNESHAVVVSEIPDPFLSEWADAVIILTTSDDHAVSWLNQRRKCPCCGAVYHLKDRPSSKQGYCDRCGSHTFQDMRDLPTNVRAQYRLWGKSFWRIEKFLRDEGKGNYVKLNIDKFNTLEDIIHQADRSLRKILDKPHQVNWNYSIV